MKILLLGEKGYLGSYLEEKLEVDTIALPQRILYSNGKKYNYVINCIGKPDLEYCEKFPKETDYSNRDIIKDIKFLYPESKIINFSSYYVYDDEKYCTEESNVTYDYCYTRQKLEGEQLSENMVTFRLGKLFGHPDINKQNKLTEYIIKNNNITLDEVWFNPTSLEQVLRVIKYELEFHNLKGIYNLANYGQTTHYIYGIFINNHLGNKKNISKIDKIFKPFHNYGRFEMSCYKLDKYVHLIPWEYDMTNYLNYLKEYSL